MRGMNKTESAAHKEYIKNTLDKTYRVDNEDQNVTMLSDEYRKEVNPDTINEYNLLKFVKLIIKHGKVFVSGEDACEEMKQFLK